MKILLSRLLVSTLLLFAASAGWGQANIEVDTPAISAVKGAMAQRHKTLAPHYASGAVGLTRDGGIAVRDANLIPLAQRQAVTQAVAKENQDRAALYREIAVANNHPEWEPDIRATFAQRWVEKAQAGWHYQNASGAWVKK